MLIFSTCWNLAYANEFNERLDYTNPELARKLHAGVRCVDSNETFAVSLITMNASFRDRLTPVRNGNVSNNVYRCEIKLGYSY